VEDQHSSPELFLFLASTVHDMKNSISVLSGTLESLLAAGHANHAPDPAYLQMGQMLYQTKRLNDNLIQLLALYKQVGKPGYPFDLQPQLVSQLIDQVVDQEKILLASKGITLQTACPPELIWTLDEDLVIGVLAHAINNAIRYTRDTIRLSVQEVEGVLEWRVEDDGEGYTEALIEAGASAMDGLHSGVNFATNSTGLGLYFSSEVAKMHKHRGKSGSIALSNGGALGGGCFILRLP